MSASINSAEQAGLLLTTTMFDSACSGGTRNSRPFSMIRTACSGVRMVDGNSPVGTITFAISTTVRHSSGDGRAAAGAIANAWVSVTPTSCSATVEQLADLLERQPVALHLGHRLQRDRRRHLALVVAAAAVGEAGAAAHHRAGHGVLRPVARARPRPAVDRELPAGAAFTRQARRAHVASPIGSKRRTSPT